MIRELKLYDLCGESTPEVLKLNAFFNELFTGLSIYTYADNTDLIFMKGDKYIMEQDLKSGYLWCRYKDFWSVLKKEYNLETTEIQTIISYKVVGLVEEAFKLGSLIPVAFTSISDFKVEEAFKLGSLIPQLFFTTREFSVEEAFKLGSLIPINVDIGEVIKVEEAFKLGSLTTNY